MKISKLFHYLYAAIMFLPLLLLPVFMIYSHRHDLSTDITIQQDVYKDFYQGVKNGKPNSNLNYINDIQGIKYSLEYVPNNETLLIVLDNEMDCSISYDLGNLTFNENDTFFVKGTAYSDTNINITTRIITTDDMQPLYFDFDIGADDTINFSSFLIQDETGSNETIKYFEFYFFNEYEQEINIELKDIQLFNLTEIFGSGNEPTKEVFESYLTQDYYDFGSNEVKVGTIDVQAKNNDIMSVFMDSYNDSLNKYFNMRRVFNLESLYQWFNINFFASAAPIGFNILFNLFVYWLFVSLLWLLFDFFMYIPLVIHNGIDKARIE